jgi:23S rRNA G2069 N7-methylase RlmK/C1962 C5-methylase RlmI
MQALFNTFIGKTGDVEDTKENTKEQYGEQYETLEVPGDQTINQIQRKTRLIKEFKKYVENADERMIYYHYIINTKIYRGYKKEGDNITGIIIETYEIRPGFFGGLYEYKIAENPDDFFRILAILDM